jgi:hypothetical protein
MTNLNPGADKGTNGEYIDADGYRRDKNGKLVRPKGMSEKEWKSSNGVGQEHPESRP